VSPGASLGIGLLGFIAGQILFVGVLRWLATVYELVKDPTNAGSRGKSGRIALATVFGSGPWLLGVAIGGVYFMHAEPYAIPLFVGATLAIVVFASITLHFASKARTQRGKNAA
jgi:hypothetical protein